MDAAAVLFEEEYPSQRWPEISRLVTVYADHHGDVYAFVCFRPPNAAGNLDLVRCYRANLGPRAGLGDPLAALGGGPAAAQAVEDTYAAKLAMFYGEPGATAPRHWHAH